MSDTPRTDAEIELLVKIHGGTDLLYIAKGIADKCKEIERELTAAKGEAERWRNTADIYRRNEAEAQEKRTLAFRALNELREENALLKANNRHLREAIDNFIAAPASMRNDALIELVETQNETA